MIAVIGSIRKEESRAMRLLKALRLGGSSAAFFGVMSADDEGRAILAELVDNDILFDPDLCCSKYPQCEAGSHLREEKLLAAFEVNTDIRLAIVLDQAGVATRVLERYAPKPVVAFPSQADGELLVTLGLGEEKASLRFHDGSVIYSQSGEKTLPLPFSSSPFSVLGSFFSALHEDKCFGVDGKDPVFALSLSRARKALEASC